MGHVLVTAAMIKWELTREHWHKNEKYGNNGIQLSNTRRTAALRSTLEKEGELVNLLEKDGTEPLTLLLSGQQQGYNNQYGDWGGRDKVHDGHHGAANDDRL
jgi:hypothetical protein